ncbi:MAG: YopX family protein, partial [Roseburia sp.]|nr:YopX family protein [Roseburia sp.]
IADKSTDILAHDIAEVNPNTVCQYTGLSDKSGRKIFEGDIFRDFFNASIVGIVRYGEYQNVFNEDGFGGHAGYYVDWQGKRDFIRKDLVYWVKSSEPIGNIFDNPELTGGRLHT